MRFEDWQSRLAGIVGLRAVRDSRLYRLLLFALVIGGGLIRSPFLVIASAKQTCPGFARLSGMSLCVRLGRTR